MQKKLLFLLWAALHLSFAAAQQDTVLMSYTVKPGLSNTDTMLVYLRSKSSNTISTIGMDVSMAFQGACADTGNGFYYSYFENLWAFTLTNRIVDQLPSSVTYSGITYTHRQSYSVIGFLQPPATIPNNSVSPGLLAFKFLFIGNCSDVLYFENASENVVLAVSDPVGNSIPFQVAKFNSSNLPVTYSFLQATALNPQQVRLDWETSQEVNNDYFAVEKSYSSDPASFSEIGRVQGVGFSDESQGYQYLDESPMAPVVYYRLKQVDLDGAFSYSSTVEVHFDHTQELRLDLYPNPARDHAVLRVQGPESSLLVAEVTTLTGQQVQRKEIATLSTAFAEETLDLTGLAPGFYLVSVQDSQSGKKATRKLLVSK